MATVPKDATPPREAVGKAAIEEFAQNFSTLLKVIKSFSIPLLLTKRYPQNSCSTFVDGYGRELACS